MSGNTQTRGQMVARYERLVKRVDTVKLSDDISKYLLEVAKTTLDMFPVSATAPAVTVAIPAWEEVESLMKSLLPSPSAVFTEEFFKNPLFPVVTLHEIAIFYGCPAVEDLMVESLGLGEEDAQNKNIKIHVLLSDFMGCDKETILCVVQDYKDNRGSADMLRRLSGRTSGAVTPIEVEAQSANNIVAEVATAAEPPANNGSDRQDPSPPPNGSNPPIGSNPPNGSNPQNGSNPLNGSNHPNGSGPSSGHDQRPHAGHSVHRTPYAESPDSNDSRKATNVFQYFKDNKFSGDISQSIELTIRDYDICARQHKLSRKQKADFFINVLADPARTFFFNHARDDMSYAEMACMMIREYNSDARQLQVQGMLETLRLDRYMSEHDISSHSDGLTKIVDLIERLAPQCQPQFRSDANKINYLRKAVLGFKWSMIPIGNIITAKYSFNSFVTALREHLQLENEISQSNRVTNGLSPGSVDGTYHQQYGKNPKHVQKHGPPNNRPRQDKRFTSSSFEESRRKGICHRCKQKWIPGHRCKPGVVRNYVRDRLKNGHSAVHIVSDLVLGLEGEAQVSAEHDTAPDAEDNNDEQKEICYGESQEELSLFDEMTNNEDEQHVGFVEEADKEWFTNHLSASFVADDETTPPPSSSDF